MCHEEDAGLPDPERRNDATEILTRVGLFGIQLDRTRSQPAANPVSSVDDPCPRDGQSSAQTTPDAPR